MKATIAQLYCQECQRTLDEIKAMYHNKHEWLYTSRNGQRLCADCMANQGEPIYSLKELNERRKQAARNDKAVSK